MMKIYQCDKSWKYLYESTADANPLEPGKYLIPAFAVQVEPVLTENTIAVWNPEIQKWDYIENNVGITVYSTKTKEPLKISELGPIPDGYTSQVPKEFDYWDGSLWITDMVLRNATLKKRKLAEINNDLETALAALRVEYPESEIMSWTKQETEARAWLRDNTRATPLIDLIASQRGLDKALLINKVIEKSDQYSFAVGSAIGRRQMLEDQVKLVEVGKESKLDQIKF